MRSVNVHEAKTNLSQLLAEIEATEKSMLICRNGAPVAELRPLCKSRDPLKIDPELKGVIFQEDPMLPLEPEDWELE